MTITKQPKFEFASPIAVHLLNVNTRKELHGEEHVQAVDLSFKVDLPNTWLDGIFSPGLLDSLYFNAFADAGQDRLEGVPESLPNLRFSRLNGQRFTWGGKDKLVGYVLRLEFGLGDALSNIELELCKVYGRIFECKEGGTVTVFFKVSNASDRLDLATCGKLVLLGGEEVTMSLTAPTVYAEEKSEDKPENPFVNQDPQPLQDDKTGGLFAEGSPEAALAATADPAWPFPKGEEADGGEEAAAD